MEKYKNGEVLKLLSQDTFLKDRYQLIQIIGEGCFGKIIKVRNKKDDKISVIKLQSSKKDKFKSILKNQIYILKRLQGKLGIPRLYYYGMWSDGLFLQMQLLQQDMNRQIKYSISQITDITVQLLKILNEIHNENILHQDLKPHNIMRSKQKKMFFIDFGLAKSISTSTNYHSLKGFIGTPRYASIRAHNMLQQSKKDDLQSLFYNIAYLFYRKLPWSRLSVCNQEKLQKIKLLKIKHKQSLFNQMPFQFQKAFEYITNLNSYQEPDYNYIRGLFKRNKTVIINSSIISHQRSTIKRLSLDYTNFLQVPDAIYERSKKLQGTSEQKQGRSLNMSSSQNINSLGIASDVILTHYLQLEQWNTQNYQSQSEQGIIPNIEKYLKNMVLKNPFG